MIPKFKHVTRSEYYSISINCSSNEIGKHKCNERKAEIKVLLGRYIDKTKGRVYQGDGNPELEEKNIKFS